MVSQDEDKNVHA